MNRHLQPVGGLLVDQRAEMPHGAPHGQPFRRDVASCAAPLPVRELHQVAQDLVLPLVLARLVHVHHLGHVGDGAGADGVWASLHGVPPFSGMLAAKSSSDLDVRWYDQQRLHS